MKITSNALIKMSIAAALAGLPVQAMAIDLTPDATRIVSDPSYLPLAGQIFGTTGYTYTKITADTYNAAGVKTGRSANYSQVATQSLAYGLTDVFSIGLSMSYTPSLNAKNDKFVGGPHTVSSDGFSDPVLAATYRVIEQKSSPVSLDLSASYAPDMLDNKQASAAHNGTVGRGGDVTIFGFAVNHEMKDLTLQGFADASYSGSRKLDNQSTGLTTNGAPYWLYFFGLNTQTRFTERLSLNAGVRYNMYENGLINGPGAVYYFQPATYTDFNIALNYHFIPNRLVGSASYRYDWYGESSNKFPGTPASNTRTKDQSGNVFGAKLQYVF